ncbi:MAG: polysaccharide deacetylase family protein [Candidatus Symbiothrix sp.]|jgi:peptidoglycan/xylan/chitin deacetylase (PgdA/CDA1 family)|nr:polysaccharide deacetylase family protein [Candidatus Symbiothrix sp.]
MMWIIIIILLLFLIYASANIRSGIYVKTISRLNTREKQLVLTFDDGPHAGVTPRILAILAEHNIRAVFFCKGKSIENQPDLVRRIIAGGHRIGNHTMNHSPWFPFYSSPKMKKEIADCQALIDSFPQVETNRIFRPPFGVTNPNLKTALKDSGYQVIGWDIRSLDTTKLPPGFLFKRIIRRIKPGSIFLFHDTMPQTPEILERVINFASENGFSFVSTNKNINR